MRQRFGSLFQGFSVSRLNLDLALLLAILFMAFSYLVQFAFNPAGAMQGDSGQYGAVQPRDWDLLSFTGQSLRNWPPVLLYLLFESNVAKVFFQFLISFLAATLILVQISSQFAGKIRLLLFVLFASLITTPQVMNWNSVLLSESILLSVTLLFVVSLRSFISSGGKLAFWPLILSSYLWCILKTTNVVVLFLIVISLLLLIGVRVLRIQMTTGHWLRVGGSIAIAGLLIVTLINQPNQEFNRGISYKAYAAIAVLTDVNPRAGLLHAELSKINELQCLEIGNPKSYEFYASKLGGECQESKLWISQNFYQWYAKYLLSHPQEPIQLAAAGFIAGNSPVSLYAPHLSILPKPIQDLFFGERNFALRNLGFQPYGEYETEEYDRSGMEVVVPMLAWLGVAFALLLTLLSRKSLRCLLRSKAVKLDYILVATGVAGVSINSIAVPTEWFRENIYFFTLIYVSLIYLIGDLYSEFKRHRSATG
jgi:hypothetical protein